MATGLSVTDSAPVHWMSYKRCTYCTGRMALVSACVSPGTTGSQAALSAVWGCLPYSSDALISLGAIPNCSRSWNTTEFMYCTISEQRSYQSASSSLHLVVHEIFWSLTLAIFLSPWWDIRSWSPPWRSIGVLEAWVIGSGVLVIGCIVLVIGSIILVNLKYWWLVVLYWWIGSIGDW